MIVEDICFEYQVANDGDWQASVCGCRTVTDAGQLQAARRVGFLYNKRREDWSCGPAELIFKGTSQKRRPLPTIIKKEVGKTTHSEYWAFVLDFPQMQNLSQLTYRLSGRGRADGIANFTVSGGGCDVSVEQRTTLRISAPAAISFCCDADEVAYSIKPRGAICDHEWIFAPSDKHSSVASTPKWNVSVETNKINVVPEYMKQWREAIANPAYALEAMHRDTAADAEIDLAALYGVVSAFCEAHTFIDDIKELPSLGHDEHSQICLTRADAIVIFVNLIERAKIEVKIAFVPRAWSRSPFCIGQVAEDIVLYLPATGRYLNTSFTSGANPFYIPPAYHGRTVYATSTDLTDLQDMTLLLRRERRPTLIEHRVEAEYSETFICTGRSSTTYHGWEPPEVRQLWAGRSLQEELAAGALRAGGLAGTANINVEMLSDRLDFTGSYRSVLTPPGEEKALPYGGLRTGPLALASHPAELDRFVEMLEEIGPLHMSETAAISLPFGVTTPSRTKVHIRDEAGLSLVTAVDFFEGVVSITRDLRLEKRFYNLPTERRRDELEAIHALLVGETDLDIETEVSGDNSSLFYYQVSGLVFSSNAPVTCYQPLDLSEPETAIPDFEIVFGPYVADFENTAYLSNGVWCSPEKVIFSHRSFGKVSVLRDGYILVDVSREIDSVPCQQILSGAVVNAALAFREKLALHGSCLTKNGRAVAALGNSGAGKSTFAAGLVKRGWRPLTDDILGVQICGDNQVVAYPGARNVWLNADVFSPLDIRPDSRRRGDGKGLFDARLQWATQPVPLDAVFLLEASDEDDEISLLRLPLAESLEELTANRMSPAIRNVIQWTENDCEQLRRMSRLLPVFRLTRTKRFDRIDAVYDAVERRLAELVGEAPDVC